MGRPPSPSSCLVRPDLARLCRAGRRARWTRLSRAEEVRRRRQGGDRLVLEFRQRLQFLLGRAGQDDPEAPLTELGNGYRYVTYAHTQEPAPVDDGHRWNAVRRENHI